MGRKSYRIVQAGERTGVDGKPVSNKVLLATPDNEYQLMRPDLTYIDLPDRLSLHEPTQNIEFVYFPNRGMVSQVVVTKDGRTVEVGVVGSEGYVGAGLAVGLSRSSVREIVQIAGDGFRILGNALERVLQSAPQLQMILSRHSGLQGMQVAQTAACNRLHDIQQRLARWLLMTQDRVHLGVLPITHDFIATMMGTFSPTDATDYTTATGTVALTVNKATPVVTWATPAPIIYGTALSATQLNATANVPGTFTYTPAAGAVLSAGSATLSVTFSPTDATDYTTATATVTLAVNQAVPLITWTAPAAITFGTALSGAQLNATANVAGAFAYSPASGTVLGAGPETLTVTFTPTDNSDYTAAKAQTNLTVKQAAPSISWAAPAAISYGTALSGAQLNATASVAGTFVYGPFAGTVLGAGSHILSVAFSPTDTVDYSGVAAQVTLQVNQATPVIAWTPASIQLGYALGGAQLDATANVPGTFTYTPPAGTAIMTTSQTLSALFIPNDAIDYTTASMSVPLTVTAGPLVSISPSSINFGTVYQGTITIKNVTVTNQGNAPMTISDPFLSIVSGGDSKEFVMVNLCPKPLGAGKSCTIIVSFIAGPFYNPQTATIQVKDNAPGSPQTVNLTATVINPQASFQPANLSFGNEPLKSSTTKNVILTNTGATALNITNIAITGTNAADFAQTSACPSSLVAGASCTISVTFTPASKNSFTAGLTITDNTSSGKQTAPLTGTGQ